MTTDHKFYRILAVFTDSAWRLDMSTGSFWPREGAEVALHTYAGFKTDEDLRMTHYVFLNLDINNPEASDFLRLTGYKHHPISKILTYSDIPSEGYPANE